MSNPVIDIGIAFWYSPKKQMMQASFRFLNDNRRIQGGETFFKKTKSITPRWPRGVVDDNETFFVDAQPRWGIIGDYSYQPIDGNCGCFRFWDFFCSREQHEKDTFANIPIRDIQLVEEKPESRDHQNRINIENCKENASLSGRREEGESRVEEEKIDDFSSCQHVPSMDEIFSKPLLDYDEDEYNKQIDEVEFKRSFSSSSFSEGSGDGNDRDNGNISSDDKSDESSASFDPIEFEEQEFEVDFGMPDVKPTLLLHDSNRSLRLPTIEENVENSFSCDIFTIFG